MPPETPAAAPLDIEFPLRTRAEDAEGASRDAAATNAAIGRLTAVAAPLRPPLPFLVERLLSAAGPFGLEVEIKSEHRVVGTWTVEVNLRGVGDAFVSQAQADLYVCGSARADPRATGAFLVVRQWSVGSSDNRQLEQLYAGISVATLERLDSLLGGVPNESGASRECVLYLVDARRAAAPVSARPAAGSAARGARRRSSDRRRRPARRPWARHRHPAARPRLDGADAARRRVAEPRPRRSGDDAGSQHSGRRGVRCRDRFAREPALEPACLGQGPRPARGGRGAACRGGRAGRDSLSSVVVERPQRVLQVGDDGRVGPAVRVARPRDAARSTRSGTAVGSARDVAVM